MKWQTFGTALSVAERRSLVYWWWYTIISTVLIVAYIVYTEGTTWYATYQQQIHQEHEVVDTRAQTEEKALLMQEVNALREKRVHIARVRQQKANPYDILHLLSTVMDDSTIVQSLISDQQKVQCTLVLANNATLDSFVHALATTEGMPKLELVSLEQLPQQKIQATFVARL